MAGASINIDAANNAQCVRSIFSPFVVVVLCTGLMLPHAVADHTEVTLGHVSPASRHFVRSGTAFRVGPAWVRRPPGEPWNSRTVPPRKQQEAAPRRAPLRRAL